MIQSWLHAAAEGTLPSPATFVIAVAISISFTFIATHYASKLYK